MPFAQNQIKIFGTGIVPAIAVAVLPKCPLCWMAILSTLGLGSAVGPIWLQPLTIFFLVIAVGALAVRARRIPAYGPLLLGIAAAISIYLFKFVFDIDAGVYISGAVMLGASVWNSLLKQKVKTAGCSCGEHA
jgi:hypothetical protein